MSAAVYFSLCVIFNIVHTGALPEGWGAGGGLQELNTLDLASNDFSGPVPDWRAAGRCVCVCVCGAQPLHARA